MANAIVINVNDKSKSAVCKETVALCGNYAITVEPHLSGNGKLVLHRKHVLYAPDGSQVSIGGVAVQQGADKWDANEVYAVIDLTTSTSGGVTTTTGTLNLSYYNLVRDMIGKYGINSNVPLRFAIYDVGFAGEQNPNGLAGEGDFDLKVVEPYYVTANQSLAMFKGDKGDTGDKPVITATRFAQDGYSIIKADGVEICRVYDGTNGVTPTITAEQTQSGCIIKANGIAIATLSNGAAGHSPVVTATKIGKNCQIKVDGVLQATVADGDDGADAGVSDVVGVATQTLPAGSAAEVVVSTSGPSSAKQFNFNFKIPKGDKGDQGIEGPMGDGSYVYDPSDGNWHQVTVFTDPETGEKTTHVAQTGTPTRPGATGNHAANHKTGGVDELRPSDIGAQAELSWDNTPTSGSNNPVKSGGIFTFVTQYVATHAANYISDNGNFFTSVASLPTSGVTNNDFAFVTGTDANGNTWLDRYNATVIGTSVTWNKKYRVFNNQFTTAQFNAMNSGLTASDKTKLNGIASGATNVTESTVSGWGFTKNTGTYSKPSTGIPATDLDAATQATLGAVASKVLNKDTTTLAGIKVVSAEPATYEENVLYFVKGS